ncbi:MAG: hypothetical protein OXG64_06345 [Chloroflexi bacterium]|nr:hypothetical protein [Chloroflexota bacterium]
MAVVVALALAVPVLVVALWRRGDWKWLHGSALVMAIVGVLWGATTREYLVLDLVAVGVTWALIREFWKRQGL